MAGRPSIVSDYVSIILRAIEQTQNDPARLRSLVYDVARLGLGKHVLTTYERIGTAGLQQHILDLETAIHHVEDLAQKQIADHSKESPSQEQKESPSQEQKEAAADLAVQLLEGRLSTPDHTAITVRDSFDAAVFDDDKLSAKTPVVVRPLPIEIYGPGRAEILQPLDFRMPAFGSGPKRNHADLSFRVQLVIAALIGIGIYAASLVGFEYAGGHLSVAAKTEAGLVTPSNVAIKTQNTAAQAVEFPLPTVYGVYAVSEGKLYELDPLPLRVPDARVAISAMFSTPSRVTISEKKLQFVIFRRDLVSSAPTEVFVRVVARVAREMKFGAGSPTTTEIDDEWAIRSKSYVFRVAPVGDSPEMIVLRPADSQQSLSPGRYALVFAGKGYDFTIDGEVTDAAQCLERSNVVGGLVYSECRTLPPRLAN
jgi:hypothetical protein